MKILSIYLTCKLTILGDPS